MAWVVYDTQTKCYVRSARLVRPFGQRAYPIFTWIDSDQYAQPFPSRAIASRWASLVRNGQGGICEQPSPTPKGTPHDDHDSAHTSRLSTL